MMCVLVTPPRRAVTHASTLHPVADRLDRLGLGGEEAMRDLWLLDDLVPEGHSTRPGT